MTDDIRRTPDYGTLETYAQEEEKNHDFNDFKKNHVYEIARNNPEVWRLAKQDFELYKYW